MTTTRILSTLLTLAALGSFAAQADASTYSHLDGLAVKMQGQSAGLVAEFKEHYSHSPLYSHLRHDALELARLSKHVHEVAHHAGSVYHLKSDLREIDTRFHHLEAVIARLEYLARRGIGHAHGNLNHVRSAIHNMETTIHHMQDDLKALTSHSHDDHGHGGHGGHAGHGGHHDSGTAVHFRRGGGIHYNNGRVSFHFGR
jgi:hypothetical protein